MRDHHNVIVHVWRHVYEGAEHLVQHNDVFFITFFLLYPRGVGPIT
jgi:hypothetical protein